MDWAWLFENGWIEGDLSAYESGSLGAADVSHAIAVAYAAIDNEVDRKRFVDMAWDNGVRMAGDKTYWYEDRSAEATDLGNAYAGYTPEVASGGAPDQTDSPTTRFVGLPGNATELWISDSGEIYAVFFVPDTDPPVPLLMSVPNEEVAKTYFKDGEVIYDRQVTTASLEQAGAIYWGDVADLKSKEGDPWAGFIQKMDRAREVMPWLSDPDVWNVIAGAYLEGRPVEEWELAATPYFREKTEAERAWMTKVAQDPATALQIAQDNKIAVYDYFERMGFQGIDAGVADFIANQWTTGVWSQAYAEKQIEKLAGGGENYELDPDLIQYMEDEGTELAPAVSYHDRVRNLWRDWLGPMYEPSAEDVTKWSGILRDDQTGGESRLTEYLRSQRLALFPEYEDATLRWADISSPWKSLATSMWGVPVDESDPEFINIVRANDPVYAQQHLRSLGIDRGYEAVYRDMISGIEAGMNRSVRGPV